MALPLPLPVSATELDYSEFNVEYFDSVIQSKGIVITHTVRDELKFIPESEIKIALARKLANAIVEKELCEFTRMYDPSDMQTVYRVRAYLTPKEECKILRTSKGIKK